MRTVSSVNPFLELPAPAPVGAAAQVPTHRPDLADAALLSSALDAVAPTTVDAVAAMTVKARRTRLLVEALLTVVNLPWAAGLTRPAARSAVNSHRHGRPK